MKFLPGYRGKSCTQVNESMTRGRIIVAGSNYDMSLAENLEKYPSFTWRWEQTSIDGINDYICYLVDEEGVSHGK